MSEESMARLARAALDAHGIDDRIVAVGQFSPRGRSGAMFAGGMLGAGVGATQARPPAAWGSVPE